jgi:FkbM family methyltransferase
MFGRESRVIRALRPIYESLMGAMSGTQGIDWTINGVTYRVDPHYRHQLGREYDAPVAAFLRERVKPGMVCLDVGANVGVYVLQFAHWVGPTGKVIAFEPNPGALEVLHRHIRMNQLMDCAEVVPVAVGATNGEAILYASKADGMSRLGVPNVAIADRVNAVRVPLVTLDDYCRAGALEPDWLFIDIEGFEINALIGARELIQSRREKLGIVVEMHPDVWSSAATTRPLAETTLTELGLGVVPLTGQVHTLDEHGIVYLAHA